MYASHCPGIYLSKEIDTIAAAGGGEITVRVINRSPASLLEDVA